ncbi:alpha/beta fold hydrolase [Massilia sp. CF038]|uniref:alpha/beta fold hydrolase n=1 Tax=Massilia sp. CF038 TaxID=1881045 RepID=UPI00091B2E6D|nr:alpha/beta hydrolase [Massilia sp. CF038]SHH54654.1 Pimeloyl-ACP methyl ester carboxylesterase [Massilia sp. CF038]
MSPFRHLYLNILASLWIIAPALADDAPSLRIDGEMYTSPQRMVAVEPGRRLNLYCTGQGSPTVLFEAGLADPISVWGFVQPAIAKRTRTCAYERAGVGFSDPATRASTSANIADDLHRLLKAAAIKPPYVLVAHSAGALSARLYAYTWPAEVKGMVLVDPTVEDQSEAYRALDPQQRTAAQWDRYAVEDGLNHSRACVAAARAGFIPGSARLADCSSAPYPVQLGASVQATLAHFEAQAAHQQAALSESEHVFRTSAAQVRAARQTLGRLPMVVLTSAPPKRNAPATEELRLLRAARNAVAPRLHAALAQQSRRGTHAVVAGAGHYIQLDQPAVVIEAIERVLNTAD